MASSASSQGLGGPSKAGRVLGPSFDKIIKNVAWRKQSQLVQACKSSLDRLQQLSSSPDFTDSSIPGFPPADADLLLASLSLALDSAAPKVIEPALDCVQRLALSGLLYCHADQIDDDSSSSPSPAILMNSVCKCTAVTDNAVELAVLRTLLASVRSSTLGFHGDALIHVVKMFYNVYLGSASTENRICAKAALAQTVAIVFARAEVDRVEARAELVSVPGLLELSDKNLNESGLIQSVQAFLSEVLEGWEGDRCSVSTVKDETGDGESRIREDAFHLYKNLCKFSMKFATQESPEDELLLRGKVLSLELMKVVVENAGPVLRVNERFLGATRQYLCLSLLKNSALSVMSVFQLLCSIFTSLLSRLRPGLKAEIGIFFPMLVLRVLENVLQPSFLQKMTVLNLLEKMCEDPQIVIDIFVNYDCDVESPNIFERIVNGLLKTALGVPPGSVTTLSPAQDIAFRHESVRCLVAIIKSMGQWMDQQLRIVDTRPSKDPESDNLGAESHCEEGSAIDYDLHSESYGELSEAATLEQRRAYKIELQKGISLFNRKPSKGIEFLISTKKIGGTPEEVASFLKNTTGLNETMIGDYLGEREELALKVMHAYVDSMNFERMNFGEAIRFFLQGFRLPGEAQKIDRIMEKFAERYCKCNPNSFSSADTAYVLAYSVIMLNTDAHNNMVKDKMSKSDFLRNNRGIDNGKDLPEDYLGSLYDQIVKNEIKMNAESSTPQKQANSINKLLGLDNILNLVNWKQPEEKALGASDVLLKHIQEKFKAKTSKSESIFYMVTNVAILRFMVEVCWAPMLAAFSVNLDQSDEKVIAFQCLQGFRQAVHVTAVMYMQTQRDAFVTSVAKFTFLHCAADMKQKNVEAVKAIISIAIEDGNYLQEAWEHILTCLSRFENLLLLGEGAPPDSLFLAVPQVEAEEKAPKSPAHQLLKKKGAALQHSAIMAVLRGGSYDSVAPAVNVSGPIAPEQINNLIFNLNMLDQIGNYELNHIFVHSQSLNSEAIVAFVKALCKVSMSELQSPSDPRVFSLMKIVEIAHYNMNRIRLVWSRIWHVLCEFFVSVGLSENLSVSIFVMDSLRQLSMKFLEREELANYKFQSEFLKPFVIVMQKSNSAEIRELIVRCVSQMVLVRVSNVKSGWKSVFMVFTTAASDERKNIVLLAFETIEKIVRDYFPYITETETTTFTDCVRCLIAFTTSRFNSDVSFNAIAFLRFCAVKLAEGGLICYEGSKDASDLVNGEVPDNPTFTDKDEHVYYWVPLLTGLSKLTSDPRPAIRKSALEVLFNTLCDHGHLFSLSFWIRVYKSIVFPIFDTVAYGRGTSLDGQSADYKEGQLENVWSSDTCALAAQYLVDLFSGFFILVRSQLENVVAIVTNFIRNPGFASIGISAFLRLTSNVGCMLSENEWQGMLLSLKGAAASTQPNFSLILRTMDDIEIPDSVELYPESDLFNEHEPPSDEPEDDSLQVASYCVSRMKGHIAVQLLVIQALMELYKAHRESLAASNIAVLLETFASVCHHACEMNSHAILQEKLHMVCLILEVPDPPSLHLENDSFQNYLKFLQTLIDDSPSLAEERGVELQLVAACEKILEIYLECTGFQINQQVPRDQPKLKWAIPLGTIKKEELAARTSLVVSTLQVLCNLEKDKFKKYISRFFPLLVNLIRCEHSSGEVQRVLRDLFQFCIGPIIIL